MINHSEYGVILKFRVELSACRLKRMLDFCLKYKVQIFNWTL